MRIIKFITNFSLSIIFLIPFFFPAAIILKVRPGYKNPVLGVSDANIVSKKIIADDTVRIKTLKIGKSGNIDLITYSQPANFKTTHYLYELTNNGVQSVKECYNIPQNIFSASYNQRIYLMACGETEQVCDSTLLYDSGQQIAERFFGINLAPGEKKKISLTVETNGTSDYEKFFTSLELPYSLNTCQ